MKWSNDRHLELISKLILKRGRAKSLWARPEVKRARRRTEVRREPFSPTTQSHGLCSRSQPKGVLKCVQATALVLGLAFTSALYAQTPTNLTAQDVVEKAIRALGGRDKMLEVNHSLIQGTLDIKSVNIKGTYKIYSARPNKLYAWFDVDTMGILERGYDGTVYWEKNSASGARIFRGDELKLNVLLAHFDLLYYDQLYKELKYKKVAEINSQLCHEVDLLSPDGVPITMHFSQTTGLPVQQTFRMPGVFQATPIKNTIMGYKDFNGQKLPSLMIQKVRDMEIYKTVQSIDLNGVLPEGIFDLPPEIKALVQARVALDAKNASAQLESN